MKIWKHFKTITLHKYYVLVLCWKCGLYYQGLVHDLSKYSWSEFKVGIKYFSGDKSPNALERQEKGYSLAWLHHKGRNKHHWEYWIDFNIQGVYPIEMPIKYVIEMYCDRIAATKVYRAKAYKDSDPLTYYQKTRSYYVIHDNTDAILVDLLKYTSDFEVNDTISYIRKNYLNKKP